MTWLRENGASNEEEAAQVIERAEHDLRAPAEDRPARGECAAGGA